MVRTTPSSASPASLNSSSPTPTLFHNVDTAALTPTSEKDVVESPSLSSSNALARFEFEPRRGTEGTKILMVEWEDDDTTRHMPGEWSISWEGKRTVLPARDTAEGGVNRLYFLLPAGERVPGTITLALGTQPTSSRPTSEPAGIVWKTNPLPAIFPPELGASAREAGKKGVLHTIWAKKRLQVLSKEIESESRQNAEGIALHMAIQERDWIEQNFGVVARPTNTSMPSLDPIQPNAMSTVAGLNSPASPRSPGGSRLMEKLKGLKLGTSERELSPVSSRTDREGPTQTTQLFANPLSPEQSDVAVSSFGSFAALKGMPNATTMAAKPAQRPSKQTQSTPPRKIAGHAPPDAVLAQQRQAGGMASLDAFTGMTSFTSSGQPPGATSPGEREQSEEDLFALPMSPRSPDMGKSPFSFGKEDTIRYLQGEKA